MTFKPEQIRPAEFDLSSARDVKMRWQDGHQSVFSFPYLRKKCGCAACIDEWTGRPRLDPASVSEDIKPLDTQPVGNYGVKFYWSDGHSTGIYAFEYLRSICPCAGCTAHTV